MTQRRRGRPRHPEILTPAEWRVLRELREGGTNAEIAIRLGVSPDAVKFHISNMLTKLGLDDRHQLAAWRPERDRRRLLGTLALPGSFASAGRPLLWMGVALGGVAVAVILVVLLVVVGAGDSAKNPDLPPDGPPVTFGDGTYSVGDDIPPGLYRATAPSDDCEWRRLRTLEAATADAADDDVIGLGEGSTIPFVGIAPTDTFFTTQGCGTWVTATPRIASGQPFGDGVWLVGPEVEPGRYRAAPAAQTCRWIRLRGFTGELIKGEDVHFPKDLTNGGATHIVDIAESDAGFISEGCGEWTTDLTARIAPGQDFGEGTYLVGAEILPGRYRAVSATEKCQWERLRAFTGVAWPGAFVALGANPTESDYADLLGTIGAGDLAIVEIAESDVGFHSRGCGAWALVDASGQVPEASFGDGTHVVGSDIAPGRYRAHDPGECTWQRLGGFSGTQQLAMGGGEWHSQNYDAEMAPLAIVDIAPSDAGFDTQSCGTWSSDLSPVETQKFGDGTYLVGLELSPGRYQASAWDGCHWIRLGGFSGTVDDRLESKRSQLRDDYTPPVVILPSDAGFFSDRCGTWRLLNAHGGSAAAGPDAPAPVRPRPPAPFYHWFRDGRTFEVGLGGRQVAPGLYRAFLSLAGCSWEVRWGEERVGNSGFGAAIVELLDGDDDFASRGCDGWTNALIQRVWPGEPFEDGAYFVGWEVAPGRYRASEPDSCSWVRLPSFRGFPAGEEPPMQHGGIVEIADTDPVFASQGCGTWTPVE